MRSSSDFWDLSAGAWTARVDEGDPNREPFLDPVVVRLCGPVAGARVLDVGCGEGRLCRILAALGAVCTGLDPTLGLLERAADRSCGVTGLVRGSGEHLPFADRSFDVVVSYLTLCDIPDYRSAVAEMARVLVPGGRLVAANVNPLFGGTAAKGWARDSDGNRVCVPLDHYTYESCVELAWAGIHIVNFHRSVSDYLTAFLDAGLRLEVYGEPVPTPEAIDRHPGLADNLRVPNFVAMAWSRERP